MLKRLIDTTFMTLDVRHADREALQRLYTALLKTGVMVQIPAKLAEQLSPVLNRENIILDTGTQATFCRQQVHVADDTDSFAQTISITDCTLDTNPLPKADVYRVTADASLFLSDYETVFTEFLSRSKRPAMLCVRGATPLATALSISWLLLGGSSVSASLLGADGYASMAEILMALSLQGEPGFCPRNLPAAARAWEKVTGQSIPAHQPVIGSHLFDVSSGVHVNGLLKDGESYEPFPPEAVGRKRRIVLDQHSGQSAVAARLAELTVDPGTVNLPLLTERVRALGQERGEVVSAEFEALVCEVQDGVCA